MPKVKKIGILTYILSDYLMAILAWTAFFLFRKVIIENNAISDYALYLTDKNFIYGIVVIPVCWLLFYYIFGTYTDIYRKSRFAEFFKTLFDTGLGVVLIFFVVILDDTVGSYRNYYQSVFVLFMVHFSLTASYRLIILNRGGGGAGGRGEAAC